MAKNISKYYSHKEVLKNLSFNLDTNSITVLFGPSGSGKTTLLRCLSLLDYPESGKLNIFNSTYDFNSKLTKNIKPNSKINLVYQQLFLYPHLTNRENILIAIDDFNSSKKELFKNLTKLLEIEDVLENYPNQSSLGQKQRIAIARVLILEPDYILFDEITSALDIVQTNNIIRLIKDLKNKGIGSLIVTHNMYVIKKLADKLVFMQNGKIIEEGGSEILKTPTTVELKSFLK
ncbi:amino acid ABC transporter ATP-binding protein [Marixanthomonas sp. SCSIO 43207]|uniref:ATP-binding cassette domain-containing protein n=1 Tax=Marixanthomonas sp. SCSIO 43207 TaxID=2779360 RepID=UPI001CA847A4|nr:ATP-binding cassette domain-containing protein [Marixanthomonas sp. SCSIO 43207]UAB80963.1 amino acid ABC transporter ATP-binding protein [Marixanthomonas sp. SCSIO 43207]